MLPQQCLPRKVADVVGKRLQPLHIHAIEWVRERVRDRVRVIAALHHAIYKVEKPSLDGIQHHHPETVPIMISSLLCFVS